MNEQHSARTSGQRRRDKAASKLVEVALGKTTGLGLVLRLYRLELGLSIRGVSRMTGVSDASVCDMENGKRCNPTLSTIRALTQLYKMKPEEWFKND